MNGEAKQTKNQRTIGTATPSQTSFLEVNPTLSYYKEIYMIWMNGEAKQTINQRTISTATASQTSFLEVFPKYAYCTDFCTHACHG